MESANLSDHVHFDDDEPARSTVFETERIWSQVLCLGRNQSLGPIGDPNADGVLTVIAGEVVFVVGGKRKRLQQWGSILVPAGTQMSVTNASAEPSVILVVTAPPPASTPNVG